jgi:LmbE family N-acetylglucosaminyl deacetylase
MKGEPMPPGVLVVAPHPDDEVLGCGGSIANHVDRGHQVQVLYLSSGEHGSPTLPPEQCGPLREQEAAAAAGVLGVAAAQLHFLRLPDGAIDARDLAHVGMVIGLLRRLRPSLVYLPHPGEASFDHREGFELCWRAAGMAGSRNFPEHGTTPWWVPTILGYEVWTPIGEPQYTTDITGTIDRKTRALACYQSQRATARGAGQADYIDHAGRLLARWRGTMSTGGYREAFQVLRLGRLDP